MKRKNPRSAKRLAALLTALVMLAGLTGVPAVAEDDPSEELFTYTIFYTRQHPSRGGYGQPEITSNSATFTNTETGEPITVETTEFREDGFLGTDRGYWISTFTSPEDRISVELHLSSAPYGAWGAGAVSQIALTAEYNTVFVSRADGGNRNTESTVYMTGTDDGRFKMTAIVHDIALTHGNVYLYYDAPALDIFNQVVTTGDSDVSAVNPDLVPYDQSADGRSQVVAVTDAAYLAGTEILFSVDIPHNATARFNVWGINPADNEERHETRKFAPFTMPGDPPNVYTIDLFPGFGTNANDQIPVDDELPPTPILRDMERDELIEPVLNEERENFRRIRFVSEHDKVTVQLSGEGFDTEVWAAHNAPNDKRVVLTSEFNHVYLQRGQLTAYYMTVTEDGHLRLMLARQHTARADPFRFRWYYNLTTGAAGVPGSVMIDRDGQQITGADAEALLPYGTDEIGNWLFDFADSPAAIPEGSNVWFAARNGIPYWNAVNGAAGHGTRGNFSNNSRHAAGSDSYKFAEFRVPGVWGGGLPPADDTEIRGILLHPGNDESQRNFVWLNGPAPGGNLNTPGVLRIWEDGQPDDYREIETTVHRATLNRPLQFWTNQLTVTGLQPDTRYHYQVIQGDPEDGGGVSEVFSFRTTDFSNDNEFGFIFFADPQIGRRGIPGDIAAWQTTMEHAAAAFPDTSLWVSGGDQVNVTRNDAEFDGFKVPDQLRQFPMAPTHGNHDVGADQDQNDTMTFLCHFNPPNQSQRGDPGFGPEITRGGGHYWYPYGGVLFMHINTGQLHNSHNPTGIRPHQFNPEEARTFMLDAIASFTRLRGSAPDWTVVVQHHDTFGPALNRMDSYWLRQNFAYIISDLDIDVVLNGHDHAYSRSHMMSAAAASTPGVSVGPVSWDGQLFGSDANSGLPIDEPGLLPEWTKRYAGETVYFTGNAASTVFNPINRQSYPLEYLARRHQAGRPEVIKIDVTQNTLTFNSYFTDGPIDLNSPIDSFTLTREIEDFVIKFEKNGGEEEAVPNAAIVSGSGSTMDNLPRRPRWEGYTFTGWNTEADGSGTVFTSETEVTSDLVLYAQWRPSADYAITFEIVGDPPNGTLSATADGAAIDSGDIVPDSRELRFTAAPADGFSVAEWTVNGEVVDGNQTNTLTIIDFTDDVDVTVEFRLIPYYAVYFEADGNGTLSAAVGAVTIDPGDPVRADRSIDFTAAPERGYRVDAWLVDGVPIPGNRTRRFTLTGLTDDVTVTAMIIEIPPEETDLVPPADGVIRLYIQSDVPIGFHHWSDVEVVEYDEEPINMWQPGQIRFRESIAHDGWMYVGYIGELEGFTSRPAGAQATMHNNTMPAVPTTPISLFFRLITPAPDNHNGRTVGIWFLDPEFTEPLPVAAMQNMMYIHGFDDSVTLENRRQMVRDPDGNTFRYIFTNLPGNETYTYRILQDSPNWGWSNEFPGANANFTANTPGTSTDRFDVTVTFTAIDRIGGDGLDALAVTGDEDDGWTHSYAVTPSGTDTDTDTDTETETDTDTGTDTDTDTDTTPTPTPTPSPPVVSPSPPPVVRHTVTFDRRGGTRVAQRTVNHGVRVGGLPTTTRRGHVFAGWWTARTGGTRINANRVINANVTFHARWRTTTARITGGPNIRLNRRVTFRARAVSGRGRIQSVRWSVSGRNAAIHGRNNRTRVSIRGVRRGTARLTARVTFREGGTRRIRLNIRVR